MLTGCGLLFRSAPPRFPQFSERQIAGPGVYDIPQWSPDGRYLAFLDTSRDSLLKVYDTETEASWHVATNVSSAHFSWGPNGNLTYLKYRPDLSGSPDPMISDLHQVNLKGDNDTIIATLSDPGDFVWFNDGERIAILLREPRSDAIYIFNMTSDTTDLLLEAQDLDLQHIVSIALSVDEKSLLLHGVHEENGQYEGQIIIYDLETQTVLDRLIQSQIIPAGNTDYPIPTIGDGTNFDWVGGRRWLLARANTPGGDCYNYALFFFDTHDSRNNFCIPTDGGIFADPTISPDLTRISYVTVVGPGEYYIMLGNVTSDLLDKLKLMGE